MSRQVCGICLKQPSSASAGGAISSHAMPPQATLGNTSKVLSCSEKRFHLMPAWELRHDQSIVGCFAKRSYPRMILGPSTLPEYPWMAIDDMAWMFKPRQGQLLGHWSNKFLTRCCPLLWWRGTNQLHVKVCKSLTQWCQHPGTLVFPKPFHLLLSKCCQPLRYISLRSHSTVVSLRAPSEPSRTISYRLAPSRTVSHHIFLATSAAGADGADSPRWRKTAHTARALHKARWRQTAQTAQTAHDTDSARRRRRRKTAQDGANSAPTELATLSARVAKKRTRMKK